jgi:hypothetical protein
MKDASGGLGAFRIDALIHYALVFFVGMAIGSAITYMGFEGSFSEYRKAEFNGQKLEVTGYLRIIENDKMTDPEVRENMKSMMRNKVQYFSDMEQKVID